MRTEHLSDVELALRPHRITGPVMDAFLAAAAIQPVAAMTYRPGTPAAEAEVQRLRDTGVLKRVAAGEWFDLRAHYALRRAAEVRAMIVAVALAVSGAVVAILFYQG